MNNNKRTRKFFGKPIPKSTEARELMLGYLEQMYISSLTTLPNESCLDKPPIDYLGDFIICVPCNM